MIVCLCRNLNERRVREAIDAGVEAPEEVHAYHGAEVNCGCCLETIAQMIAQERTVARLAAE